jgi:hypothetical protein
VGRHDGCHNDIPLTENQTFPRHVNNAFREMMKQLRAYMWSAPVTKTADFSLAATENLVINNKSGSACVVTLPSASSFTGRVVTFKTIQAQQLNSASSDVVPLAGGAAGTAILTGTAGRWATLVSDGTNWVIMAGVV